MALLIGVCIVIGYLLGNLNGAIFVSRWFHKEDVRQKGSGNAGLTNFFRNYGGVDTLLVLLIDVGKTALACLVGGWIMGGYAPAMAKTASMICGAMAVVGHVFPVLFGFRGGKGVLACGVLAAFMDWKVFLICILLFIILVLTTRYVSLGSVVACTLFPIIYLFHFPESWAVVIIAFVVAGLTIFMHRANIVRLLKGTESKLSFSKNHK